MCSGEYSLQPRDAHHAAKTIATAISITAAEVLTTAAAASTAAEYFTCTDAMRLLD